MQCWEAQWVHCPDSNLLALHNGQEDQNQQSQALAQWLEVNRVAETGGSWPDSPSPKSVCLWEESSERSRAQDKSRRWKGAKAAQLPEALPNWYNRASTGHPLKCARNNAFLFSSLHPELPLFPLQCWG